MSNLNTLLIIFYVLLLCLTAGASYYRSAVTQDYTVSFEGICNPATESCYFDCVDAECIEINYYTNITRKAAEVSALCGPDITQCTEASKCSNANEVCIVSYCDPVEDMCDDVSTETL